MLKIQKLSLLHLYDFHRTSSKNPVSGSIPKVFLKNLLNLNIVPIVNENDVLSSEELVFSDNDQLACRLSAMVKASKLVILTNVDGLYDKHPNKKGAKLISEIKNIKQAFKYVSNKKSRLGKGGMESKLKAAQSVVPKGIKMQIINGLKKGVVLKSVLENKGGTLFKCES